MILLLFFINLELLSIFAFASIYETTKLGLGLGMFMLN